MSSVKQREDDDPHLDLLHSVSGVRSVNIDDEKLQGRIYGLA